MTTIWLYRSKRGQWLTTTDTEGRVRRGLTMLAECPAGVDGAPQEVVQAVRECNPGCRVLAEAK
jgi:thiamine monophosphate kinase